jgi:hypothetical protein
MKWTLQLVRQFRRWLHYGRETWLIVDQKNERFLECVVVEPEIGMIMQRWVRSPARAYTFTAYQRDQIEQNKLMPEGGSWLHVADMPQFRGDNARTLQ